MNENEALNKISQWIPAKRQELVSDLIGLVNIKSVQEEKTDRYPFGLGPARAIDKGIEYGARYGFRTDNDYYYSLSFLLPGSGMRELGILGHIDVVPEGNGWSFDPYNAVEKEDYVLGRGSGDNKGASIAALYVLRLFKDLDIRLNHTVRVIWGANEESGMEDIAHYLETHKPPEFTLVCDASFPLCYGEKGILSADLTAPVDDGRLLDFYGGVASNSVPDNAYLIIKDDFDKIKKYFENTDVEITKDGEAVRISAKGIAGHAAFPDKSESAILKLAQIVSGAGIFSGKTQRALSFIAGAFADTNGAGLGLDIKDDIGTNTTHIGGYVRFRDGKIVQNINVRFAIRADQSLLVRNLKETAEKGGFSVENIDINQPRYDSLDDPKIKLLLQTAREFVDPNAEPYTMGGGTHARKMPNAVPYGPGAVKGSALSETHKFGHAHSHDEAVYIPGLLDAVKIYAITLIRLDKLLTS